MRTLSATQRFLAAVDGGHWAAGSCHVGSSAAAAVTVEVVGADDVDAAAVDTAGTIRFGHSSVGAGNLDHEHMGSETGLENVGSVSTLEGGQGQAVHY
jgi:hypothetical protein